MKNNPVVTIVLGAGAALLALSLIGRFVLLSDYGVSGGWLFFGLPFGGIGLFVLLLRLGVLNFGGRPTGTGPSWPRNIGVNRRRPGTAAGAHGFPAPAGTRQHACKRRNLRTRVQRKARANPLGPLTPIAAQGISAPIH